MNAPIFSMRVNTTGSFAKANTAAKQSQNRNNTQAAAAVHKEGKLNGDQSRGESYSFFQPERRK